MLEKVSQNTESLAESFGLKVAVDLGALESYRKTFNHRINAANQGIVLLFNYRGDFWSPNKRFRLTGRNPLSGTAQLAESLPFLGHDHSLYAIIPPLDIGLVDYLISSGWFIKGADSFDRTLTVNLLRPDESPLKAILNDRVTPSIPKNSLLVSTYIDDATKEVASKYNLTIAQGLVNSYIGNSKIRQRNSGLPMLPSIPVRNKVEALLAKGIFSERKISKFWIKSGNGSGAGQFMHAIKTETISANELLQFLSKIDAEQAALMNKECLVREQFEHSELMIEADASEFGEIFFSGSVHTILSNPNYSRIVHYAKQIYDSSDPTKQTGVTTFEINSETDAIIKDLLDQVAVFSSNTARNRGYLGVMGADVMIIKGNDNTYSKMSTLAKECGQVANRWPLTYHEGSLYFAVINELNERETKAPPLRRLAISKGFSHILSFTPSMSSKSLDYKKFKEHLRSTGIPIQNVLPLQQIAIFGHSASQIQDYYIKVRSLFH